MHGFKAFADCDQPNCASCLRFMERNKLRQRTGYSYYEVPRKITRATKRAEVRTEAQREAANARMRRIRENRRKNVSSSR